MRLLVVALFALLLACVGAPAAPPDAPAADVAADSGRPDAEVWPDVAVEPPPPVDAPEEAEAPPMPDVVAEAPAPDIGADVGAEDVAEGGAPEDAATDVVAPLDAEVGLEPRDAPDDTPAPDALAADVVPPCSAASECVSTRARWLPACVAGRCVEVCPTDRIDCDGRDDNGCEAIITNRLTCGACGRVCERRCTRFPGDVFVCS